MRSPFSRSTARPALLGLGLTAACALAGCARPRPAAQVPPPPAAPAVVTPPSPTVAWRPAEVTVETADPSMAAASSFVVVPAARIGAPRAPVAPMDLRLLYGARNGLESRGYQWAGSSIRNPDLVVAVDWRFPSPGGAAGKPLRRSWPERVTALPGDRDAIAIAPEWGLWPPPSRHDSARSAAADDPAAPPAAPLAEAASELPWRTATVRVTIFDSSSGTLLWEAEGRGATQEWRGGVALPRVLDAVLARLPRARRPAHRLRRDEGRLGVRLWMATDDGRHFYPRVEALAPGLPAAQELEVGDRILEIETTAAADLPLVDLYDLLRGPPGTVLRLRVAPAAGGEPRVVYIRRVIGRQP